MSERGDHSMGPAALGFRAGAEAEARARNSGLTRDQRSARATFESMARLKDEPVEETLATLLYIFAAGRTLRTRLRLAWRVLR